MSVQARLIEHMISNWGVETFEEKMKNYLCNNSREEAIIECYEDGILDHSLCELTIDSPELCVRLRMTQQTLDYVKLNFKEYYFYEMIEIIEHYESSDLHDIVFENLLSSVTKNSACEYYLIHAILRKEFTKVGLNIIADSCSLIHEDNTWFFILSKINKNLYYEYQNLVRRSEHFELVIQKYICSTEFFTNSFEQNKLIFRVLLNNIKFFSIQQELIASIEHYFLEQNNDRYYWYFLSLLNRISVELQANFIDIFIETFKNVAFSSILRTTRDQKSIAIIFENIYCQMKGKFTHSNLSYHLLLFLVQANNAIKSILFSILEKIDNLSDQDYEIFINSINNNVTKGNICILEMSSKFLCQHLTKSEYLFETTIEYLKTHTDISSIFVVKAIMYSLIIQPSEYSHEEEEFILATFNMEIPTIIEAELEVDIKFNLILGILLLIFIAKNSFMLKNNDFDMVRLAITYLESESDEYIYHNDDFRFIIAECLFCSAYCTPLLSNDVLQPKYDITNDLSYLGLTQNPIIDDSKVIKNFDNISEMFSFVHDLAKQNSEYQSEFVSLICRCLIGNFSQKEHSQIELQLIEQHCFGSLDKFDNYCNNVSYISIEFLQYLYEQSKFPIIQQLLEQGKIIGSCTWYEFSGEELELSEKYAINSPVSSLVTNFFRHEYKQIFISFNEEKQYTIEISFTSPNKLLCISQHNEQALGQFTQFLDFSTVDDINQFVFGIEIVKEEDYSYISFLLNKMEKQEIMIQYSIETVNVQVCFIESEHINTLCFDDAPYEINIQRRRLNEINNENYQFCQYTSIFEQCEKANIFFKLIYDLQSGKQDFSFYSLALLNYLLHFDDKYYEYSFRENLLLNYEFFEYVVDELHQYLYNNNKNMIEQCSYLYKAVIVSMQNHKISENTLEILVKVTNLEVEEQNNEDLLPIIIYELLIEDNVGFKVENIIKALSMQQLLELIEYENTVNEEIYSLLVKRLQSYNINNQIPMLFEYIMTTKNKVPQRILFSYFENNLLLAVEKILKNSIHFEEIIFNNISDFNIYLYENIQEKHTAVLSLVFAGIFYNDQNFTRESRKKWLLYFVELIVFLPQEEIQQFITIIIAPTKYCLDFYSTSLSDEQKQQIYSFLKDISYNNMILHRMIHTGLPHEIYQNILNLYDSTKLENDFKFEITCILNLTDCHEETLLCKFISPSHAIYELIMFENKTHIKNSLYVEALVEEILTLSNNESFYLRALVNDQPNNEFPVRKDLLAELMYVIDETELDEQCYENYYSIVGDYQLSFVYEFLFGDVQKELTKLSINIVEDEKALQNTLLHLQNYEYAELEKQEINCCFKHDAYYSAYIFGQTCPICNNMYSLIREYNRQIIELCEVQTECISYSQEFIYPGKRLLIEKAKYPSNRFYFHPYYIQEADELVCNCLTLEYTYQELSVVYINKASLVITSKTTISPKYLNQLYELLHFEVEKNRTDEESVIVDEYGRKIEFGLYDMMDEMPNLRFTHIYFRNIREIIPKYFANFFMALEIILNDGQSIILIFDSLDDYRCLMEHEHFENIVKNYLLSTETKEIIKLWREAEISSFAFLLAINYISGRSYIDLYEYPIFPFVSKDREYNLPIGSENEEVFAKLKDKQKEYISSNNGEQMSVFETFYSHRAITSHYLFEIEPFTSIQRFLEHGIYDCYDREFISLEKQWDKVLNGKSFSELIPEFFSSWEFESNLNQLEYNENEEPDVIVEESKYVDIIKCVVRYRNALENLSSQLAQWCGIVFGGAMENDTFPSFTEYRLLSNFENPDMNKALFYGVEPNQILAKQQLKDNSMPVIEFDVKDEFYLDEAINNNFIPEEVPTPYINIEREAPYVSNNIVINDYVVEQEEFSLKFYKISKESVVKCYRKIDEIEVMRSLNFTQMISNVQKLNNEFNELIVIVGGRLCLIENFNVYDLGIEFCDAYTIFEETRQIACIFNGIIITYQIIDRHVREIARRELEYYEQILELTTDSYSATFSVLLKLRDCCQLETFDYLLHFLGQKQLTSGVSYFSKIFYFDLHMWTLFTSDEEAILVDEISGQEVFQIQGRYIRSCEPLVNYIHLQQKDGNVKVIEIWNTGIM